MSTDDMVFEEVRYREPRKARRPDRDRKFACVAYEVPGSADLPIFLDLQPADAIERHALRDTSVELGGILLGLECLDDQTGEPFVWITRSLEAKHYENTQASFTYTHDSWEEITRERDRLYPDLDIVGWYHTHPDFGIFLSSHDLFIHRNFFAQPLQLAYVVDPIRQTRGFFRLRDGGLDQVGGFYLSSDRNDRVALARFANNLESIPNAESGGGGLSPRLEAELIAMLSRPHQSATSSQADRAQAAAFFAMMGLFAGVLLVVAGSWLYTLTQQITAQTTTLEKLAKSVDQTDNAQQLAIQTLLDREGNTRDPRKFVDDYARSRKELDDARASAEAQARLANVAAAENRRLEREFEKLKKAEAEAEARAKSESEDAEKQREEFKKLTAELEGIYKTPQGELSRNFTIALYSAIGGWVVALLAGLGLVALWASRSPITDEPAPAPAAPPQEPPHQIV
ncbi:Mov34/MPN/PAD-1 family protein [Tundrisphaera lichenicola]|uniref:Mov34/MPN/PAD-1 family protein n=1 Tax=Tundrisphaera lichenicola TaxID=2029860 RepID=UPI003EBD7EB2